MGDHILKWEDWTKVRVKTSLSGESPKGWRRQIVGMEGPEMKLSSFAYEPRSCVLLFVDTISLLVILTNLI